MSRIEVGDIVQLEGLPSHDREWEGSLGIVVGGDWHREQCLVNFIATQATPKGGTQGARMWNGVIKVVGHVE